MKKIKLLLAAMAAMVSLGVQAGSDWVAPSAPSASDPVSGQTYKIRNVGAGQYLSGGAAWFSWATSAILADVTSALEWTITGSDEAGYTFACNRGGNNKLFTSGNNNAEQCMHVDGGSATTYFVEKQANGYYRLRQSGVEGKFVGGPDGKNGVLAQVDPAAPSVSSISCDWEFVPLSALTTYAPTMTYAEMRAKVLAYANATDVYTDKNNAKATLVDGVYAQDDVVDAATTAAEVNAATEAIKALVIPFVSTVEINEGKSFDITDFALTNPSFELGNMNGWTNSGTQSLGAQGNKAYDNVQGSWYAERWHAAGTIDLSQTVSNLPAGRYELKAYLSTGGAAAGTFAANNSKTSFDASKQYSVSVIIAENEDLVIRVTGEVTSSSWFCVDGFTLAYSGAVSLTDYEEALANAVTAAKATEGTIPTAAYNAINDVVTEYNKTYSTADDYATAINAIEAAIGTYASSAIVAAYTSYNAFRNEVLALDDDATVYAEDIQIDVTAADDAVAAATTADAIKAAIPTLKEIAKTFVTSVTVNEGKYFDVTNLWVVNPTVSVNTDGWEKENVVRPVSWGTGPTTNYGETEFYQSTFDFNQSITLPKGTWEFGVTGFHRAGNHSTYFYAGDDKILIPGVESSVVNTMAEAKTYFDNGNGKVALKFGLEDESNVIKIGIVNNDTETDRWTIFRNFTLKYYGSTVDYSVYAARWEEALAVANAAKADAANANVTGSELTTLNAAIADAPTQESKKADYNNKINALIEATAAFTAAAASYDKYVAAKAETEAIWGSDLNVAAPTTAAEAAVAAQTFNVAQYNKVATEYTFSATGLIGDFGTWKGTATVAGEAATPNYLDWEHWSGQTHAYYEQAAAGWGNENGWTIKYEKTCTLPAGDYVIKVAARSSGSGVTSLVSCSATGVTLTLPAEGSRTRGINTSGVASWSDSDTFANGDVNNADYAPTVGGTGTGWQWRFLPFTLTEQTEVTMTFYAEASTQYQWMSIGDGELLSTTKLAQNVAYDEAQDNTIENTIIADVTMTRNIKEGFNTLVVPFTLTANQVAAAFGIGTEVYAFSENGEENAKDLTINFTKGDGSITANVPVLVKATAASTEQVFNGVQIVAPAEGAAVEGKNANFVGVFGPTTVGEGHFFVGNGAIYKSAGSTNIKAFRAYILLANPDTTPEVKMFIDGVATRISDINGMAVENGTIYNIAGQRVNNAQKGIFIINGKKVVK